MKYSIFALPALLRPAILLASASQHSFSVVDDIFAFPQYEVRFSDDYLTEAQARHKLEEDTRFETTGAASSDQVGQYQPNSHETTESDEEDEQVEYTHMMLGGQQYLCEIPQVSKREHEENTTNETVSKADKEKELARAADRGWELLRGMQGSCVYFISGWWSYKFCYNDGVKQFHQLPPSKGVPIYPPMEDPGTETFTLGKYQPIDAKSEADGEEPDAKNDGPGELIQRGDSRYLVQRLEGGTKCDLTGKERKVEVQFHCNPQSADKISLIKETSTCAYLMVIQTPRLCNDVAFQPPQEDRPNTISCKPVLAEDRIADYVKDLRTLRNAEKEADIWAANAEAAQIFLGSQAVEGTIVGDIVVGGHTLVPEDVKLQKSWIVGGGETVIGTVATSDGQVMSKEELKKLGLGDWKTVEKLMQQLEKVSAGKGWKLDVVEGRNGRTYRGILGTNTVDQDGKDKKGKKGDKSGKKGEKNEKEDDGHVDEEEEGGSEEEYYFVEL